MNLYFNLVLFSVLMNTQNQITMVQETLQDDRNLIIKKYANINNKFIEAITHKLFRFRSEADAIEKIDYIKENFIIAKNQEENPPKPCVILWIKEFNVTQADSDKGYTGNYAFITYEKTTEPNPKDKSKVENFYTISATKIDLPAKDHPQRKRKKEAIMPNFGHPLLRSVKKGDVFSSIAEVNERLQQMHLEYPKTTIPGVNKMYLMIYSRDMSLKGDDKDENGNRKPPFQKYILEIKTAQGGGFVLEIKENEYIPKGEKISPDESVEKEVIGKFTSKVILAKNKKA